MLYDDGKTLPKPEITDDHRESQRMTMTKTRYALVGAGARAQMYVEGILGAHRDRAELVAIVEPNPVRSAHYAGRIAEAGAPAPRIAGPDDLEQVVRDEQVDRVIICARDDLHAELIVRALEASDSHPTPRKSRSSPPQERNRRSINRRTGAIACENYMRVSIGSNVIQD